MNQDKKDKLFFFNEALDEFKENGGDIYHYYRIKDISDNKWLPVTSFRAVKKLIDTGKLPFCEIGVSPTSRDRMVRGDEIVRYNAQKKYEKANRETNVG